MNYKKHYDNLINKATLRTLPNNIYYEKHHILPKSMGGSDDVNNIVCLLAREHFVAHLLLKKIYNNKQMIFALNRMLNSKTKYKVNSRTYKKIREEFSVYIKEYNTGKHP